MKNKVIYTLLIITTFFCFFSSVEAETKKYINMSDRDSFLLIDKNKFRSVGNSGLYELEVDDFKVYGVSYNDSKHAFVFTDSKDPTLKSDDKWWSVLYVCKDVDYGFLGFYEKSNEVSAWTSSMLSNVRANHSSAWAASFGGNASNCWTFKVQDVPEENQTHYCPTYESYSEEIEKYASDYKETKDHNFIKKYREVVDTIRSSCNQIVAGADYDDPCIVSCLGLSKDKTDWDKKFNLSNGTGECGFSYKLIIFIKNIMKWIKYIIPVAVIILGILDFIKAIASSNDDEMKKAQSRFVKRLIAAALIFIVPLIIEFVLDKMGFSAEACGIIDL